MLYFYPIIMENNHFLKNALLSKSKDFVKKQEETITNLIASLRSDLNRESKSSAGDKHETGRAMLQLEMEKSGQQLQGILQMQMTLQSIQRGHATDTACLGALVLTNKGNYYLAVSVGEIWIEGTSYFIISTKSPIGQQLLGKKKGDHISFNGATISSVL